MAKSITEATAKVHAILEPFESDERRRVVNAALILLGDDTTAGSRKPQHQRNDHIKEDGVTDAGDFPPAAGRWLKKNGLEIDTLEHYFHFDDGNVQPIELPGDGKSKREKTINTYLMQGVAALLQSGTAAFDETAARDQCRKLGCYDSPNHGKYLKQFGNQITGSKSNGWKLTVPGLTAAAKLLKPVEH